MIMTYDDIVGQVRQFQTSWKGIGQLQKCYSSSRFISISLRESGKSTYLIFGRGKGFEGLWLSEKQIPSVIRKKDRFLEYLRKHLGGARLLGIEVDQLDRIIYIKYQKFGRECIFGVFYKGRQLLFANKYYSQKLDTMKILCSWDPKFNPDSIVEAFDSVGRTKQEKLERNKCCTQIVELLEEEIEEGVDPVKDKRSKNFINRKYKNIKDDLEKNKEWVKLRDYIEKNSDFDLLPKKTKICGFKINFQEKSNFKRRDELYNKVKKLKRGEAILSERLKEVKGQLIPEKQEPLEKSKLDVIEPLWGKGKKENEIKKTHDSSGFYIVDYPGFKMGVGTTAHGNDQLRKNWGKKEDWWFHLDGQTSAHIIVKTDVLDEGLFKLVGKELIRVGGLQTSEVNLIYTQVKNLKGIAKSPGSVNFKKEKRLRVYLNEN
tara:strand:+ start:93402 stop:94694 length:1293 start_codon:yes stop_codon:yes gene_type:complete